MGKLKFQSPVSQDPPEIILKCWFVTKDLFLIINNVENSSVLVLPKMNISRFKYLIIFYLAKLSLYIHKGWYNLF